MHALTVHRGELVARVAIALAIAALPLLTWMLLRGGTGGTFMFDDLSNLAALDTFDGGVTSWGELRHYLSLNASGPTGRPLSMLTFLLQQYDWPGSAAAMLEFNLLLHGLTGLIVALIAHRLARRVKGISDNAAGVIALLAGAIWLLHPIQVSTVFYVIQRMAQLSTLFVLLGLYAYIVAREHLEQGRLRTGAILLACTPLLGIMGMYAKENAILLPLALLLTEYWFFRRRAPFNRLVTAVRLAFLWLPAGVILAYLVMEAGAGGYDQRPFGPGERLATQMQAMLHYLHLLAIPRSITPGIFYDSFPVAASWLSPSVLLGVFVIASAIILSVRYRKQAPLVTWGILFFLAMHAIESTTRPLELVYEHRNYLPSAGLALAAAAALIGLWQRFPLAGVTAIALWLALSSAQAHVRAETWGDPDLLIEIWTEVNPDSPRMWLQYARRASMQGDQAAVDLAYDRWRELRPDSLVRHVSTLVKDCPQTPLPPERIRELGNDFATGYYEHGLIQALSRLTEQATRESCRGLRVENVYSLTRMMLDNPEFTRERARMQVHNHTGELMVRAGFIEDALDDYARANAYRRSDLMLIRQTIHLASYGFVEEALAHLRRYRDNPAPAIQHRLHVYWLLFDHESYFDQIERQLEDMLEEDTAPDEIPAPTAPENHAGVARSGGMLDNEPRSPAGLPEPQGVTRTWLHPDPSSRLAAFFAA